MIVLRRKSSGKDARSWFYSQSFNGRIEPRPKSRMVRVIDGIWGEVECLNCNVIEKAERDEDGYATLPRNHKCREES